MLSIKNLKVSLEDGTKIVKGVDLDINSNEVVLIMGPNGAGKSSLVQGIMGNFNYEVEGVIILDDEEIQDLEVEERAQKQLFLSFQQPIELPGVTQFLYLKTIIEKYKGIKLKHKEFRKQLEDAMNFLEMKTEFNKREMNVGFSGGERKKNELLQLLLLEPKVAVLDEIDSGVDVDGLRTIKKVIEHLQEKCGTTFVIVSHHEYLLKELNISQVVVLDEGVVAKTGGKELGLDIIQHGFRGKSIE